jgi:dethiobiotin synthetase
METFFITGTDTNIGKTHISIKLLDEFNKLGLKTIGIKPVATGCINGKNEDALLLQKHSSIKLDYHLINPFAFKPAISPNIASPDLTIDKIWARLEATLNIPADIRIIEGVGGWMAPINSSETMADLVTQFKDIKIILVVGIKLGCLNHSILTYNAIPNLYGWIANIIDPEMEAIEENISTLKQYIKSPLLRTMNYEHHS